MRNWDSLFYHTLLHETPTKHVADLTLRVWLHWTAKPLLHFQNIFFQNIFRVG